MPRLSAEAPRNRHSERALQIVIEDLIVFASDIDQERVPMAPNVEMGCQR